MSVKIVVQIFSEVVRGIKGLRNIVLVDQVFPPNAVINVCHSIGP